jgi:hypothetical protein
MASFKTAAGGDTAKILRNNKCMGQKAASRSTPIRRIDGAPLLL